MSSVYLDKGLLINAASGDAAVTCNNRAYDIITRIMRNKPGVEDESDAA